MKKVADFFFDGNVVEEQPDYTRADIYVRAAEAFANTTYQSVYIIDYYRHNFLYVSSNPMFLCGLTAEQMMEMDYRFYVDYVPEEEQPILVALNKAGFDFFSEIPIDERLEWYIQYDFNVVNDGRKILINHKLSPLALTDSGRLWLALCVVSASTHTTPGHVELHRSGSPDFLEYNLTTGRWDRRRMPTLSDVEKSIITLSIRGYTMTEIADNICLSAETVKKYRQRIFEKLGVRNISEAIGAAINSKLL